MTEPHVHVVRGRRVLLDTAVAALYGVSTAVLNRAADRNIDRFPGDFAFRLTGEEVAELSPQPIPTRRRPRVFTAEGVVMVSTILRSPAAARTNVAVLRSLCAALAVA